MKTILVVDDNNVSRKLVKSAFETQGMQVLEASSGEGAIETFSSQPIELVLQDLVLPDLDGFELVRRLRLLPRGLEVPILAYSGMLTSHDEARVHAAGFDDLISKPIEPNRLLQIVRAHLPLEDHEFGPFGEGRSIIVADDDAVQRKLAAFKLESLGFDVLLARDGAEALSIARRTPPSAVLSDVLMPHLDGFGLCAAMRRDTVLARVPLVLTTNSYVEPADRELALKAGANGLVHRTPDLKDVMRLLKATLATNADVLPSISGDELEHEHKRRMMRQLERQVSINAGVNQRCAVLSAEIAVLKSIAEALASRGSIEDALRHALAACFDAGGISLGALFLQERGGRRVLSRGFADHVDGELESLWGEPQLLEFVLGQEKTLVLPDGSPAGRRLLNRCGAGSVLMTPVRREAVTYGALLMMARSPELLSDDRLAFAEAVAGQISQALAVTAAFEQQEAAERTARERAALLRSILESIGDGVAVADSRGNFIQWNAAASSLVKLGPWNTSFKTVTDSYGFYGGDKSTAMERAQLPLVRAMRGESVDCMEMFVRHPGATEGAWLSVSSRPLRDEDGYTRGGVAVFRDVSREKEAQSQLMVSDRMASMGMLAAGVAHEINNPLAALIANLDLIRSELGSGVSESLGEMLGEATEAAERVRLIVRDVKMFSRQEEGESVAVDINQVLDSSLRLAFTQIRLCARLVKDYGFPVSVRGTESRLGQVFLNLLVNAAQAIPEGNAAQNTIRVSTRVIGTDRLAVEVSDSGGGMPPETMRQVFKPFFTTKPVGIGTGLGLSICQGIINSYDGEIQVESEVGRGTTFRVVLPLATSVKTEPAAPPELKRTALARRRGSVLLVDDEKLVGSAVRRVLHKHHDVVAVESVDAALELLAGGATFDVILSDLMMPEKTGIDLFHELVARHPGLESRLVFLTGGAFTPEAESFLESVPNPWIEKPFKPEVLRARIDELVT